MHRSRQSTTVDDNKGNKIIHGMDGKSSTPAIAPKRKSVTSSGYGVISPSSTSARAQKERESSSMNTPPSSAGVKSGRLSVGNGSKSGHTGTTVSASRNRSSVKRPPSISTTPSTLPNAAKSVAKSVRSNSVNDNSNGSGNGGNRAIYTLISPLSAGGGGSGGRTKSIRASPRTPIEPFNFSDHDREVSNESKDSTQFPSPTHGLSDDTLPLATIHSGTPILSSSSPTNNKYVNLHEETPIITKAAAQEKKKFEGLETVREEDQIIAPSTSTDTEGTGTALSSSGSVSTPSTHSGTNPAIRKSLTRPSTTAPSTVVAAMKSPRSNLLKAPEKIPPTTGRSSVSAEKSSVKPTNAVHKTPIGSSSSAPSASTARRTPLSAPFKAAGNSSTVTGATQVKAPTPKSLTTTAPSVQSRLTKSQVSTPASASNNNKSKTVPSSTTSAHDRYSSSTVHSASKVPGSAVSKHPSTSSSASKSLASSTVSKAGNPSTVLLTAMKASNADVETPSPIVVNHPTLGIEETPVVQNLQEEINHQEDPFQVTASVEIPTELPVTTVAELPIDHKVVNVEAVEDSTEIHAGTNIVTPLLGRSLSGKKLSGSQVTPFVQSTPNSNGSAVSRSNLRKSSFIVTPPQPPSTSPRELLLIRNNRISNKIVDISKQIVKSQQKKEEELYALKVQQLQQQLEQFQQYSSNSPPTTMNMSHHLDDPLDPHGDLQLSGVVGTGEDDDDNDRESGHRNNLVEDHYEDEQNSRSALFRRNKFLEDDRNSKRNSFPHNSGGLISAPPIPGSRWGKPSPSAAASSPANAGNGLRSGTPQSATPYEDNIGDAATREKSVDRFPTSLAMSSRSALLSSSSSSSSSIHHTLSSNSTSNLLALSTEENLLLDQMPPAIVRHSSPIGSPIGYPSTPTSSTLSGAPFNVQQLVSSGPNSRMTSPFVKRIGSTDAGFTVGNHVTTMAASLGARHMSPLRQPSPSIQSRQLQQQKLNQRLSNSSVSSAGSATESSAKSQLFPNSSPSASSASSSSVQYRDSEVLKLQEQAFQKAAEAKQVEEDEKFAKALQAELNGQGNGIFLNDDGSVVSSIGSISTDPVNQSISLPSSSMLMSSISMSPAGKGESGAKDAGKKESKFPGGDLSSVMSNYTSDSNTSDEQFKVVQPFSLQKHHLLKPALSSTDMSSAINDGDLFSVSMSETEASSAATPKSRQSSVFDAINKGSQPNPLSSPASSSNQRNSGNRSLLQSNAGTANPMKKPTSGSELSKMVDDFGGEDISMAYGGGSGAGQYPSLLEDQYSIGIAERPASVTNAAANAKRTSHSTSERSSSFRSTPQQVSGPAQKSPMVTSDYFHPILEDSHNLKAAATVDVSDAFVKDIENDVLSESGSKSKATKPSAVPPPQSKFLTQTQKQQQQAMSAATSQETSSTSASYELHQRVEYPLFVNKSIPPARISKSLEPVKPSTGPLMNKPTSQLATVTTQTTTASTSIPSDYHRVMSKKQREIQRKQMFDLEKAKNQNVKIIYRRFKAIGNQWENAQTEISSTDEGVCLVIILPYLFQLDVKLVPATMFAKSLFSLKKFRMNLFAMNCITDVSSVLDTSSSGYGHRPESFGSGGSGDHGTTTDSTTGKSKTKKSNHYKKALDNQMTYEYTLDNTPQDSADAAALYLENEKGISGNPGGSTGSPSKKNAKKGEKNRDRDSNSLSRSGATSHSSGKQRPQSRRRGDDVSTLTNSMGGPSDDLTPDLESDYLTSGNSDDEDDEDVMKYETIKVEIHANRHIFSKEKRITDENTEFFGEYKLEGWNASLNHRHVTHRYDKETGLLMIFIDRIRPRELDLSHYVKNNHINQSHAQQPPVRNTPASSTVPTAAAKGAPLPATTVNALSVVPHTAMDDDNASVIRNITKRGRYHFPGDVQLDQEGRLATPLAPKKRLSSATGSVLSSTSGSGSSGAGFGGVVGGPFTGVSSIGGGGNDNESIASSKSNRSHMRSMGGGNTVASLGSNRERFFPRGLAEEKTRNSGVFSANSGKFNPDQDRTGSPFHSVKKNRRGNGDSGSTVRSNGSAHSLNSASQSVQSAESTSPAASVVQPYIGTKTYEI